MTLLYFQMNLYLVWEDEAPCFTTFADSRFMIYTGLMEKTGDEQDNKMGKKKKNNNGKMMEFRGNQNQSKKRN